MDIPLNMGSVTGKLNSLDKDQWHRDVSNDRNIPNGNTLRIYRLFKTELNCEHYTTLMH